MNFTYILTHFITSFVGVLTCFYIVENLASSKSLALKKIALALAYAPLAILLIPVFEVSLAAGRIVSTLMMITLIKYFAKLKWSNAVLAHVLGMIVVMISTYAIFFVVEIFGEYSVIYSLISYPIAVYASSKIPIYKAYNFFADRLKPVHAVALIAVAVVVAAYSLMTMWADGDVRVVVILTIVFACLFFVFYKVAKYLEIFKKVQDAPIDQVTILDDVLSDVSKLDGETGSEVLLTAKSLTDLESAKKVKMVRKVVKNM